MTKSELIGLIAKQQKDLLFPDVQEAVSITLDYLSESLALGKRIEIRGFGSFSLRFRLGRVGRNPKTGEKVQLDSKYVPYFKAGKEVKQRVTDSRS